MLGAAPVRSGLDALAWRQAAVSFSGDDLELAHRLLLQPEAVLARGTPQVHPEIYDVVIVGAGSRD